MTITKHGNTAKNASEEFICSKCGCVFSATLDEYYVDKGSAFDLPSNYIYRSTITDYLVCSCPECHKIVVNKKDRIIENPTITLSGVSSTTTAKKEDVE